MSGLGGIASGILSGLSTVGQFHGQNKLDKKEYRRQKQILQNQLQWRVKDAKKAGIHPLASMGLSPASGPSSGAFNTAGLRQMGQDIGRAIDQALDKTTKKIKAETLNQAILRTQNMETEGQILKKELENLQGPPSPTTKNDPTGQGNFVEVPARVTASQKTGIRAGTDAKDKYDVDSENRFQRTKQDTESYSFDEQPVSAIKGYIRDFKDWDKIRKNRNTATAMQMVLRKMPAPTKKGWIVKYNPINGEYRQFPPYTKRPNALYFYSKKYENLLKMNGKKPYYGNRKGYPNKVVSPRSLDGTLMKYRKKRKNW